MKKTVLFLLFLGTVFNQSYAQSSEKNIPIPKGNTKLAFQDEFNGKGLPDKEKWDFEKGYIRNSEKQFYAGDRKENVYLKDGYLHLVARNDSAVIDGKARPITSASIHTKNTFAFKYGKIEIRAKLPFCLGTWPAIWLMPTENKYGWWPKSGEIDIMEHVGYDPEKINYAIHTESNNHKKQNGKGSNAFCPTCYTEFHTYGLEWHEDRIEWFLDGKKRFVVTRSENATWEAWPFDQNFYLILNLAFGGGWGGTKGIDPQCLPQEYIIDYVRIFQ